MSACMCIISSGFPDSSYATRIWQVSKSILISLDVSKAGLLLNYIFFIFFLLSSFSFMPPLLFHVERHLLSLKTLLLSFDFPVVYLARRSFADSFFSFSSSLNIFSIGRMAKWETKKLHSQARTMCGGDFEQGVVEINGFWSVCVWKRLMDKKKG